MAQESLEDEEKVQEPAKKKLKQTNESTESDDIIPVKENPAKNNENQISEEGQIAEASNGEIEIPMGEPPFKLEWLKNLENHKRDPGYAGLYAIKQQLEGRICPICKKKGHYGATCDKYAQIEKIVEGKKKVS